MSDEHAIQIDGTCATLSGVLRLESSDAYARLLSPVLEWLQTVTSYTIDVRRVVLLNSSGIRALGTLVLQAKKAGLKLTLRGRRDVPWQKKSMASLAPLYPTGLTVELV